MQETAPKHQKKITRVIRRKARLQQKFVSLLGNAKFCFSQKQLQSSCFLNRLKSTLTSLHISPKFKHKSLLRAKRREIEKAIDVYQLFFILERYLESYIDYELLKYLIKKFGDNDLKQKMRKYEVKFEKFANKTTIDKFSAVTQNVREIKQFNKIIISLRKDPASFTFNGARQCTNSLAHKSGVHRHSVRMYAVKGHSVELTLAVPLSALELIIPALDEQFWAEHNIASVTIDGKSLKDYDDVYVKVSVNSCVHACLCLTCV